MRVLYLTTEFPLPADSGGKVRSLSQLRLLHALDEVERVTVLTLAEEPVPAEHQRALAALLPKASIEPPVPHPIRLKTQPLALARVALLRVLEREPYLAVKWTSATLRRAIERALGASRADVAYVDHLGLAVYLDVIRACAPRVRVVLDQHNVESDIFRQFAERKRGLVASAARFEWRAARRFEIEALRAVDAVGAISPADADGFAAMAGVHAEVVPQVVRFERTTWAPPARPSLVYVGNLSWHPNVAGLDWFCAEVWPRVRAALPDATLKIAGIGLAKRPSGEPIVPLAWQRPGIETIGYVEKLEPLYAQSSVMIAPIVGGSGLRMKLLEAFRAGMPSVTTPDGALGLAIEDGREALVAATPAAFGDRVVELASSEELQNGVREAAYAFLDTHFSEAVARAKMRALLGLGA